MSGEHLQHGLRFDAIDSCATGSAHAHIRITTADRQQRLGCWHTLAHCGRSCSSQERPVLGHPSWAELGDQLGLERLGVSEIADRHGNQREQESAMTLADLRRRAAHGVQLVTQTWAGNRFSSREVSSR